jgi:hypothetical protein
MAVCALLAARVTVAASGAPAWMHAQVNAPLPAHDEETNAVMLYSETILTVLGPGKMKRLERRAYKILRREGEDVGTVGVGFDSQSRITFMRGWSIPAQGKDFETKDKDIIESGHTDVDGGELVSDVRLRILRIPGSVVGNIVGYEVEQEERPYTMSDDWGFQGTLPVREASYFVQLPPGWSYKAFWLNHAEQAPSSPGAGQFRWTVSNVAPMRLENKMPPWHGVAGKMVLALQPPDGQQGGFQSWQQVGAWYLGLTRGRRDASPAIKSKVQELTAGKTEPSDKMQVLASFVQKDIRYVGIELGIGGHQPHAAAEVYTHRFGDCKDKATLLSSMLEEIGIHSYYVIINTVRGSILPDTPPNLGFNHAILAIQLPEGIDTSALPAFITHKRLGKLLFFDPTQDLVPLGHLPGSLQANYGMLVTPDGGELLELPQPTGDSHGVKRTAKLTLDENGNLSGDVVEVWSGDPAVEQRSALLTASQDIDQIKPVESMLTHSLGTFHIVKAAVANKNVITAPLEWHYTLQADRYAKVAGDLLLVRPRVMGNQSSGLLETKYPRVYPIEFETPERNTDEFEITLPPNFTVDDLPPAVNEDLGFVAYRSSSEVKGKVLRYTRTFEIKQLSVPPSKANDLKNLSRIIAGDERNSAVLKRTTP